MQSHIYTDPNECLALLRTIIFIILDAIEPSTTSLFHTERMQSHTDNHCLMDPN